MSTRERRPTVYVLSAAGYRPAGSFQRRLGAALRDLGIDASIRLLRPHTEAGIRRLVARTKQTFLEQTHSKWLDDWPVRFTTVAETSLNRDASGVSPCAFALVVLVSSELTRQRELSWNLRYPVQYFLRKERPDALIPVLHGDKARSRRSPDEGMRLLAPVSAEDWRRPGDTAERFKALANRLRDVLAVPFPADIPVRTASSRSLVRVDVNGGGDCVRISEALTLAADGGRVEVYPGDYNEAPQIQRPVHLVGVGPRETIRVQGLSTRVQFPWTPVQPWHPVKIRATVENLSIGPLSQSTKASPNGGTTLWLNGGELAFRDCSITARTGETAISDLGNAGDRELRGRVNFERCIVDSKGHAATLASRAPVSFRDCVFLGEGAPDQYGLCQYYGAKTRILRCMFVDFDWSVFVQSAGEMEVRDSVVLGGTVGMHVGDTAQATMTRTHIIGALWNLQADEDAQLTFERCSLEVGRQGGLAIRGRASVIGWDNRIDGTAGAAVKMAHAARLLLAASRLRRNLWGIEVIDSALAEVVGCTLADTANFSIGYSGRASAFVRANTLQRQTRGVQVTEEASGEVSSNIIRQSEVFGIGIFSRGKVQIAGNDVDGSPAHRIIVAPEATATTVSE